ncbi:MAG: CHAT domain-containing protein [Pseudomonadota bacterium]
MVELSKLKLAFAATIMIASLAGGGLPRTPDARAQQSVVPVVEASLSDFKRAAIEHARFQACFKSKLSSGYCQISSDAADTIAALAEEELESLISSRLRGLSRAGDETAALIYHEAPDGSLGIFFFDKYGIQDAVIRPSTSLDLAIDGLKRTLSVNSRSTTIRGDNPAPLTVDRVSIPEISDLLIPSETAQKIQQGGYSRLIILPSRTTSVVPFPALTLSENHQLVDQTAIVFLPDLDALTLPINPSFGDTTEHFRTLSFDKQNALVGTKIVVGDPDYANYRGHKPPALPGARQEAESVASLLSNSESFIGHAATHQAVVSAIRNSEQDLGMIYFATHGVSDSENPMDGSLLALAEQHLIAQEIKDFDFRQSHPLVILSACQTGLGKQFDGGTFGLMRSWYASGAGQVVGSLWNVSDVGTRYLMTSFIEQLNETPVSPEEALRVAMLQTREEFSDDPAIWASFYVFGNPALD